MSARATRSAADRQNLPVAAARRQILACFCRRLARKIVVFHRFVPRPRFCIDRAGRALALRVQECLMSFSVNSSNANNPFAQWQALLQQDTSTSSSAQSDPTASLLAALGQGQSTGTTASSGGAGSSSTSSTATSGSSSPQFGAQTLQTLFDMQANAAPSDGATSSSSNTAGSANVANNNLLERLIQMQAQLINPATAQNVATA
jgi:hypothetical protein